MFYAQIVSIAGFSALASEYNHGKAIKYNIAKPQDTFLPGPFSPEIEEEIYHL